jgi:heme-degrading monooxygenase HmoA
MIPGFAKTPAPPYYAVIFTSKRTEGDNGYNAMMDVMAPLSAEQPGYLGRESARTADGFGVTVIYYKDEAAILAWKNDKKHLVAQEIGRQRWYEHYEMRVCKVERAYAGPEGR